MIEASKFAAFVMIGGFAALVNFLARIAIDVVTSYEIAIVLAFPVGLITAFVLNRTLVFEGRRAAWHGQFWRFLLVNLIALGQVFVVSVALARYLFPLVGFTFHAHTAAHAVGLASPIVTSYWGHKYFSFGTRRAQQDATVK